MINRSSSESRGQRKIEVWTRHPSQGWTVSETYQSGIFNRSETFTCVNGEGGSRDTMTDWPTAYSFSKEVRTYGTGRMISGNPNQSYSDTTGSIFGSAMAPSGTEPVVDTNMANVYNEALSKIGESLRGNLDLAIDLAEYKSTGAMLRNLHIPRLYNYVRSFHPKKWADKWLEFQYGWKPLVGSIYAAAEELNRRPPDGVTTLRGRAREKIFKQLETSGTVGVSDLTTVTYSKRVEIQLVLNLTNGFWDQAARISSLNPASIVWELTPYSFVADWLIDIGGYLRNLENALMFNLGFQMGYATYGQLKIVEGRKQGLQKTGPSSFTQYMGATYRKRTTTKNRVVLTGFPLPYFPHPKLDLGSQRALSTAALMYQHFSKR